MGKPLTSYQRGIVKRFYEHRDTIALQKVSELVSELYLCDSPKQSEKLWARVEKHLHTAGGNKAWIKRVVSQRDLEELALIVQELY